MAANKARSVEVRQTHATAAGLLAKETLAVRRLTPPELIAAFISIPGQSDAAAGLLRDKYADAPKGVCVACGGPARSACLGCHAVGAHVQLCGGACAQTHWKLLAHRRECGATIRSRGAA